jgi:ribosomal protein S18 acetylase RimI-like enzyme
MTAATDRDNPTATIRPATPADAPAMARFVDMAGEGLPHCLWSRLAGPGEDPWSVGAARAARDAGAFSWTNASMLELAGEVVGCLVGYPLADPPEPIDRAGTPPLFIPMLELEAEAPGSWYVNVLAIDPARRGRGLGERLLAHADAEAERSRCAGTSLIVADSNTGARRFYARHGYRELASRPMVKEAWNGHGERWILCRKPPD